MTAWHRFAATALAAACMVWPITAAQAATCQPGGGKLDTRIALFPYIGDPVAFSQFNMVIAKKFRIMSDSLTGRGLPDIGDIDLLPLHGKLDTPQKQANYMSQNPYLSLWQGVIQKPGATAKAVSYIYLCPFKGPLSTAEVTLSLPIIADDGANKLYTHSIVTFYALAMNAIASKCPANVPKAYLDQALASFENLKSRGVKDNDD